MQSHAGPMVAMREQAVVPARPKRASASPRRGSVVDVFCGIGGLSHGFVLEGFDVRAGIDTDASCRHAYERNNGARFLEWNVDAVEGDAINSLFVKGQPRILVGCAPCQPFSTYTQKRMDAKWRLLREFGRLVSEIRPDLVSMENVPRLAIFRGGELFSSFLGMLEQAGYSVWWGIVACADYGVPQTRKRLVVLASRLGPIELIPPTHRPKDYVTVRHAIGDLVSISAGEQDAADSLHRASRLSSTNLARIKAAKPGGSWRDWHPELIAKCHRKRTGRGYGSVYGRMSWDALAPTITTQCHGFGNGRFGHPEQNRAISLREAALLQTFPRSYEFFGSNQPWSVSATARWIGNAVPVALARAVARSVAQTLEAKSNG